ncbi:MAG: protein O-GlcNAcase [Clostridia bacterium]
MVAGGTHYLRRTQAGPPSSPRHAPASPARTPSPKPHPLVSPAFLSGVVEGYYGAPWSVKDTQSLLAFMAARGFTTFVYAPKGDPYARAQWNMPYPKTRLGQLADLVKAARAHHIQFVYSISPGLNIVYSSAADRAALLAKVKQVASLGVRTFMLSFDDVPTVLNSPADQALYPGGLGQAQSTLADWLIQEMRPTPGFRLLFTPTYYYGLIDGPYWTALRQDLHPGVDVIWTGPQVLSPTITAADARTFASDVGHPVVIWDNYPVNDYTYTVQHAPRLFLGPIRGRSAALPSVVAGFLANPMRQARASEVALYTLAAYLAHPGSYNPGAALAAAVASVGAGAVPAFQTLADDASGSFLGPSLSPLPSAIAAYENAPTAQAAATLTADFRGMAAAETELAAGLRDRPLLGEIRPWAGELSREGQAGLQALTLLSALQSHASASSLSASLALAKADLLALQNPPVTLDTTAPVLSFLQQAVTRAGS